jgi:hypothetical protein
MKRCFNPVVLVLLTAVSCSNISLDEKRAVGMVKEAFHLSDKDRITVLGMAPTPESALVLKLKIYDDADAIRFVRSDGKWKIDAASRNSGDWTPLSSSIEDLLDSRTKDLTAVTEIENIAAALGDYITDFGKAPVHNGALDKTDALSTALQPNYIEALPIQDPWGNPYLIITGESCNSHYGISEAKPEDFLIISLGRFGEKEDWAPNPATAAEAGYIPKDYSEDIIRFNGTWLRAPKGIF